jgi:hypothetical protein
MTIRQLAVGLGFAALAASPLMLHAASGTKTLVDHKGNVICVSEDAVPAHLAHGDSVVGDCTGT